MLLIDVAINFSILRFIFYCAKRRSSRFLDIQERGGSNSFTHGSLTLKYKLDNEFELVFVVSLFGLN